MDKWIDVAADGTLTPGDHEVVELNGVFVAVFYVEGQYYAIEDSCSHDGGELASGPVDGLIIECPRHGAEFCLRTGKVLSPPAYSDIQTYPVRVHDGIIQIASA